MRASLNPAVTDRPALALLELCDLSTGFAVADRVAKQAEVELLLCEPVTPGKFLLLFAGDVDEVLSAAGAGKEGLPEAGLVDELFLPGPHPSLLEVLRGRRTETPLDAVGVVETLTVSAALRGADAALKVAAVELRQMRAAMRLHGRAFFTVGGEVSQVEVAISRALEVVGGQLHAHLLLPRPHASLLDFLG